MAIYILFCFVFDVFYCEDIELDGGLILSIEEANIL